MSSSNRDGRDGRNGHDDRGGGQAITQDYIARVRYSNALPPPPMPPKLLDIPGTSSSAYTTPGYASRMARRQPLNVDADAEGGMPLDLVGMPNIFEGDESSIQAPLQAPPLHPDDRALLRPLHAMSRSNRDSAPVAFLRRTEYISSVSRRTGGTGGPLKPSGPVVQRKPKNVPLDPRSAVKRKIDQSFEAAQGYLADPSKVKHPKNKRARCVGALPLLPDLDAFPDSGTYVTMKFKNNPMPAGQKAHDQRLLAGIFMPQEKTEAEDGAYQQALEAHARDPLNHSHPGPNMDYNFFLPRSAEDAARFRAKFDVDNPEKDEEDLYTAENGEGGRCFAFPRLRAYETVREVELDHETKYTDTVLLAFNSGGGGEDDDDDFEGQRAVYYYPVMQRSEIRPQRQKRIHMNDASYGGGGGDGERRNDDIDQLDVFVQDPTDAVLAKYMHRYKEEPFGWQEEEVPEEIEEVDEELPDEDEDAAGTPNGDGAAPARADRGDTSASEQDAEGSEEDE